MNFSDRKPEFITIFLHEILSQFHKIIVAVKMTRKREKNRNGRIYCDFFAQHSILDNFSGVNVVKF